MLKNGNQFTLLPYYLFLDYNLHNVHLFRYISFINAKYISQYHIYVIFSKKKLAFSAFHLKESRNAINKQQTFFIMVYSECDKVNKNIDIFL